MAKLTGRQRIDKRKRKEALHQLGLIRKEQAELAKTKMTEARQIVRNASIAFPELGETLYLYRKASSGGGKFISGGGFSSAINVMRSLTASGNTSLHKDTLLSKEHKTRLYVGGSLGLDMPKHRAKGNARNKVKNPLQGPAFAQSFMAPGHELLAIEDTKAERVEIKLPPSKRWRVVK